MNDGDFSDKKASAQPCPLQLRGCFFSPSLWEKLGQRLGEILFSSDVQLWTLDFTTLPDASVEASKYRRLRPETNRNHAGSYDSTPQPSLNNGKN